MMFILHEKAIFMKTKIREFYFMGKDCVKTKKRGNFYCIDLLLNGGNFKAGAQAPAKV